jgi:ribonuclease P protein component
VLAADDRLRDSGAFRRVIRTGLRAGSATLVVHLGREESSDRPPRVGLVVSRAVGNAVVRNQVKRRLRHVVRDHLAQLPRGSELVIRALPSSAGRTSAELDDELARSLSRVARKGSST